MSNKIPKRILIVLHGAIGDVTRALPLAVRIKRAWPKVHLAWAVEPISYPLVSTHPAIDRVHLFERQKGFPAFIRFTKELRSEGFDLVLDLQRHIKSGVTSLSSGAPRRIGFHRKNAKEGNWLFNTEHIDPVENFSQKIWHYQLFGDKLGLPAMNPLEFGFRCTGEQEQELESKIHAAETARGLNPSRPSERVLLVVGSSWESRFWKEEYFAEVARELYRNYGLRALIVGGMGEQAFSERLLAAVPKESAVSLVSKTSLFELTILCKNARLAIGCDSGPMHIAAAQGLAVISLWGSTSPKRSAPYGSEQLVLQSPIGCSPCYKRVCPGLNTVCMADLPPKAVLSYAHSVLRSFNAA